MIGNREQKSYRVRMATSARKTVPQVEVVEVPGLMGGKPCVEGTRVLAETIRQYLIDGYSAEQIFEDYPYLPIGAIEAVERWAAANGLECSSS